MSGWDLLFLAAGGVIGSGWLFAGTSADKNAGSWAVGSWLVGGLLVLVVTAVMVEVSTKVPKTGSLIFVPLQTSGPLFATLVAAGVWGFYAANPASESVAMVKNLAIWQQWPALFNYHAANGNPTWGGIWLAAFFLLFITAVNLLGPRRFLAVNNVLTAFKIFVPLLVVVLLGVALIWHPAHPVPYPPARSGAAYGANDWRTALSTVVVGVVAFSYLGFQGPLDFAGNVRGGGIGEAARLRRAVYGTVLGSILLYTALQGVNIYLRYHSTGGVDGAPSVYPVFAGAVVRPDWLASAVVGLINVDSVLSPAGTAMVFTYVMTREVAALSRAHLTHRGLQRSKNSVIRLPKGFLRAVFDDDRVDVYWWILFIDFVISLILLLFARGYDAAIQNIPTILALLVYATPGVALAALRQREPSLFPKRRYAVMAYASFAALGVVFVAIGSVGWGMVTFAAFCLVLLGLPVAAPMARWYDARAYVSEFRELRTNTGAQLAAILGGYYLGLLVIAEGVRRIWPHGTAWGIGGLAMVAAISVIVFRWLVRLSVRYMTPPNPPPLLPKPLLPRPLLPRSLLTKALLTKALLLKPPIKPDAATAAGS
jgi:amino acid transporter